jgi:polyisoprenoid-binding protein YceI
VKSPPRKHRTGWLRHWKLWLLAVIVAIVGVTVVAPFVFIHFIESPAPPPLSLGSPSLTANSSSPESAQGTQSQASLSGVYVVRAGSEAEYRVSESLVGQTHTAVGISMSVTGSFTLNGTVVSKAAFTVPLNTVHSDQSQRDDQFDNRIMDIGQYPNAVFVLTQPIDLGAIPGLNVISNRQVTGNLTMHGVTKSVTFTLQAEYTGSAVKVSGSIPITFADWNIQNPSGGPAQVGNTGTMGFLLTLSR